VQGSSSEHVGTKANYSSSGQKLEHTPAGMPAKFCSKGRGRRRDIVVQCCGVSSSILQNSGVVQLHEAALHEEAEAYACRHAAPLGNSLGCSGERQRAEKAAVATATAAPVLACCFAMHQL
jgi:hypothetical protein